MQNYVMTRTGSFNPSKSTSNQCKDVGHEVYEYECKVAFDKDTALDEKDFLVDHVFIHDIIKRASLSGSCERMQKTIMDLLISKFKRNKIKIIAIKLVIKPVYPSGSAFLTYIWYRFKSDLLLLNI